MEDHEKLVKIVLKLGGARGVTYGVYPCPTGYAATVYYTPANASQGITGLAVRSEAHDALAMAAYRLAAHLRMWLPASLEGQRSEAEAEEDRDEMRDAAADLERIATEHSS